MGEKPETPSPDAADNAAKKERKKGRPSKAELEAKAVAEQQAAFISQMSASLTKAVGGAVGGLDAVYSEELELVNNSNPKAAPMTFALSEAEDKTVALSIALALQQTTPEMLARFGLPIMAAAVALGIGVPRLVLAHQLGKIRADLAKRKAGEPTGQPDDNGGKVPDRMPKDL
jgi:hypothetical protein